MEKKERPGSTVVGVIDLSVVRLGDRSPLRSCVCHETDSGVGWSTSSLAKLHQDSTGSDTLGSCVKAESEAES